MSSRSVRMVAIRPSSAAVSASTARQGLAFGKRLVPVQEPVERAVVLLEREELFELLAHWPVVPAGAAVGGAVAGGAVAGGAVGAGVGRRRGGGLLLHRRGLRPARAPCCWAGARRHGRRGGSPSPLAARTPGPGSGSGSSG